ncbi:hypothetical protein CDAR_205721 [Caerostris darwini]|uniref:Uncharacterized protein n=1 Tax=Caerostris darwini TaxID=1538125 RepID=A0AAV4WXZ8_9ARAC|nr:hypothetical protein CDAR_205721 [Caerostris darwini]
MKICFLHVGRVVSPKLARLYPTGPVVSATLLKDIHPDLGIPRRPIHCKAADRIVDGIISYTLESHGVRMFTLLGGGTPLIPWVSEGCIQENTPVAHAPTKGARGQDTYGAHLEKRLLFQLRLHRWKVPPFSTWAYSMDGPIG